MVAGSGAQMNMKLLFLRNPNEPPPKYQRTISIWLPKWLRHLLKANRLVINIDIGPP
jgi:hypothetical protein